MFKIGQTVKTQAGYSGTILEIKENMIYVRWHKWQDESYNCWSFAPYSDIILPTESHTSTLEDQTMKPSKSLIRTLESMLEKQCEKHDAVFDMDHRDRF